MTLILATGASAFLVSLVLAQVCKAVARRLGVVSRPRTDRWNRREVPLLGGVAMAASVFAIAPIALHASPQVGAFLAGAAVLFLVGLADDLRDLRPWTKVTVQILVGALLAAVGLQLRLTSFPIVNVLLTIFWVTAVTNAVNLLDNMDGLAAGIAAIGALYRLGFFVMDGNLEGARLTALVTGATLGFLVHNFPPATIFMGDAGSLFLGFCLSGLSLVGGYPYSRSLMSVLLLPVLLLLVPIFDTTFVTITRSLARRPVSVGGQDHTSHRLVALGLSPRAAILSLYFVALLSGAVSVFTYRAGLSYGIVLVVFLLLSVAVLAVYLSRIRVYPQPEAVVDEAGQLFTLITTLTHNRQLATLLVDVVLMAAAYYTAYLLRFEDSIRLYDELIVKSLPVVTTCQVAAFWLFRVHHGVWRYTGLHDAWAIARAASAGTAAAVVVLVFVYRFEGFSRAVFILDGVLLIGFVSAARLSMRLLAEVLRPSRPARRRVLIYGAGESGLLVCREVARLASLGRTVVGFLDDDPRKQYRRIEGVKVLGGCDRLEAVLLTETVDEVVLALHSMAPDRQRLVTDICQRRGTDLVHASLRFE